MDQHVSSLAQAYPNAPPSAPPTTPASTPLPPPPSPSSQISTLRHQLTSLQHETTELRRERADHAALATHIQTLEDVSAGWQAQCADLEALLAQQRPRTRNLEHVSNVMRAKRARLRREEREGVGRLRERDGGLRLRRYGTQERVDLERAERAGLGGWEERLKSAWEGLETPGEMEMEMSARGRDGSESAGLYGCIGEEWKGRGRGGEMMVREEGEEEMGLGSAVLLEEGEAWRLRRRGG